MLSCSINVNKLLAALFLPVCLFIRYFILHFVVVCLLLSSFFILMWFLYFCSFVDHINKSNIFVFGAFVYNYKNTISNFVMIFFIPPLKNRQHNRWSLQPFSQNYSLVSVTTYIVYIYFICE